VHFNDFEEVLCVSRVMRGESGPEDHLNPGGLQIESAPDDRLEFGTASVFEGVGKLQNSLLPEGGAINLQADRQSFGCLTAGN
jgi:hypothetical protein